MPETYDEIIARFDDCHAYDGDYVIEALSAVREAVGGDPAEWFALDGNGNRVRIGDKVTYGKGVPEGTEWEVEGFGVYNDVPLMLHDTGKGLWGPAPSARKVIPDTRDVIITDTINKLFKIGMLQIASEETREIIGAAIDRGAKLAEVDA